MVVCLPLGLGGNGKRAKQMVKCDVLCGKWKVESGKRNVCSRVFSFLFPLSSFLLFLPSATAQSKFDSLQHVREIVVVSKPAMREVVPSQKLNGEMLEKLSTHSVADALRYFSGIQLKDYGGVGGIKTVNIRSMGTHHLGISYDGIQLGNAQNGQIDLGQFSMDNVEEISLYNGQKSAIFQPASEFASAGAVYIRTRRPLFNEGEHTHLRLKAKYGSSDMIRVSGLWEEK